MKIIVQTIIIADNNNHMSHRKSVRIVLCSDMPVSSTTW